jgi:hypothetical protein
MPDIGKGIEFVKAGVLKRRCYMLGIMVTLVALFTAIGFALHPEDNRCQIRSE